MSDVPEKLDLSIVPKLLDLLRAAVPVPDPKDAKAVTDWLVKLAPALGAVVAAGAAQFTAKGTVAIPEALPEGFDGKWLDALKKALALLPAILEIVNLLKAKDAAPTPPVNA